MYNLYFPISSLFTIILIVILFFSKKRIISIETKVYKVMILSSLVDIILGIIILLIGHEANYYSFDSNKNYILDRFYYSTIIRLNYELKRQVIETVNEILDIDISPDFVIYLNSSKQIVLTRIKEREKFNFDNSFFEYEKEIFEQLSKKCDKINTIDGNNSISEVANETIKVLQLNNIFLKGR